MVNPVIYPVQRRPGSGPAAIGGGSGGNFLPSDNIFFFDPEYSGGSENGSIAGPFLTWADWTSGITGGTGSAKVIFPGVPVTPGVEEIPLAENFSVTLEGLRERADSSYVNDTIEVPEVVDDDCNLTFRHLALEDVNLNGGNYSMDIQHCRVESMQVVGEYTGLISCEFSSFGPLLETPDSEVRATGGNIEAWQAQIFILTDLSIGTSNGSGAGILEATGTVIRCRCVTFADGSTIEFSGAEGALFLDPVSYRSYLDSGTNLINGAIIRDDGSWPADAALYSADVPPSETTIDFAQNPRATLALDNGAASCIVNFVAPLTREVEMTTVQGEDGGCEIDWSSVPNLYWSDGVEPDQDTTAGCITQYRFDYEQSTNIYLGYVVIMNAQIGEINGG